MWRNIKISIKIALLIAVVSTIAILAISLFTYRLNVKNTQEYALQTIKGTADIRATELSQFVEGQKITLNSLKNITIPPADSSGTGGEQAWLSEIANNLGYTRAVIVDNRGIVQFSSDGSSKEITDPDGDFFTRAASEVAFSKVITDSTGRYFYGGVAFGGNVLLVHIPASKAFGNLSSPDIGKTAEVVVAQVEQKAKRVTLITETKNKVSPLLDLTTDAAEAFRNASEGNDGNGTLTGYHGQKVMASWRQIKSTSWALVAQMDEAEYNATSASLLEIYYLIGASILILCIAVSMLFTRMLVNPLNEMRHSLDQVSKGVLPENLGTLANDEFGKMGEKVEKLVSVLRNHADFAQKVGEGKFDTPFAPASENDALGIALINMRNNLVENARLDDERNWIVRGVAEVSEILRQHDNLDSLGDDIIQFIIRKINAVQGAFYIVNEEAEPKMIEIRASFAYGRKKYLKKDFRFAEGLVGQAAAEQDIVLRTEIPNEYVTITSGILGDQKPVCILIAPLIANEEVYGVVELAGLQKFTTSQVKFVQELSMIIARTIFNIKVNDRTRKLLTEAQTMSAELKEKQQVLNQNAEEMQATQEELKRSNLQLEEQIQEVGRTQKRMQLLLENASEVITIYEENGTIRYISPSVESILGYSQKEMQGRSDLQKVHPEGRDQFKAMFEKLRETPDDKFTVQYEYQTREGQYIWLEATGTNCMGNPAIHGYIVNSRDITEKRRAEQEQRMRSKMQALSENSPDLITRLEEGVISYINPVIESYTGHIPGAYLGKKANETSLDLAILDQWLKIVEHVNATNENHSGEMTFPSVLGNRIMQVNAIPEFNEAKKLESVLVVSHDITERKLIELEVQDKNKKINDSINYSKRIQNAILPNSRVLSKVLPNSFILYKPRDVVSGDFPWFVHMKNEIFLAAVDCTGHGVPGAMLSLIGYFLLNDIVRSRKISEAGLILDLLDEGVTQTLRQDQDDSATKDGMDIALVKINLDTNEVQYAGAHRPLYYFKDGALQEIKGNKFPIGGGIFKNQTNFTTHTIQMTKGDSMYFSSDGYPDQFGGPEVRKLGPKRVREMAEKAAGMPMKEAYFMFDREWEEWKGTHKQTDDVLLIGIKF